MKSIKFLLVGIVFGTIMYKAQLVSWFRIYEMFRFESFHMYGVIGSAVGLGIIFVQLIKRFKIKSIEGQAIEIAPKDKGVARYLLGGTIFGLGWALAGACPGPMYVLVGTGAFSILIVIAAALLGTFVYGLVMKKLPH
jgi:uncharacterized membrane protein YedE/YeeE